MVTRGMLGVTVACARCHDHKYDPFTAKDYYALAGVFASTAYKEYPLVPEAEVKAWKKHKEEMDTAEKELNKFLTEQSRRLAERFGSQIAAYMVSKSLERNRFVAYNRIFGEKSAPLSFDRELTAELLEEDQRPEYDRLKKKFEDLKKTLPAQYAYLHGAEEFEPMDLNLNIRGNPEALGDVVPRRFPTALSAGKSILFNHGS